MLQVFKYTTCCFSEKLIINNKIASFSIETTNRAFYASGSNNGRGNSRGFYRGGRGSNSGRGYGRGGGILPSPTSTVSYTTSIARPASFTTTERNKSIYSGDRPIYQICHRYGHSSDEYWNIINFTYQGRNPLRNLQAMLDPANVRSKDDIFKPKVNSAGISGAITDAAGFTALGQDLVEVNVYLITRLTNENIATYAIWG